MLEVILLGGLRPHECERYQHLKMLYYFSAPFSLNNDNVHVTLGFLICGTRQPFTTVVPSNSAYVEGVFKVLADASFKLKYSAMDIQVSTKHLKENFNDKYSLLMTSPYLLFIVRGLFIYLKL